MKPSKDVVAVLNAGLNSEITAITRYMAQSLMCQHQGLSKLADYYRKTARGEMEHAEHIMERLALFGESPTMSPDKVVVGPYIEKQISDSKKSEQDAIVVYTNGIQKSVDTDDGASLKMFQDFLHDEEKHLEWTEAQEALIKTIGLQNYLQAQM
jgi:bacterioferritin